MVKVIYIINKGDFIMELQLAIWIILGFNRIIINILKGKVEEKVVDLIDILSIFPIVPVFWSLRHTTIENVTGLNKTITFYMALFSTIVFVLLLMRRTYLYNKE